jgi:hypothetical protein
MTDEPQPKRKRGNPNITAEGVQYRFQPGHAKPWLKLKKRRAAYARKKQAAEARSKTVLDLLREKLMAPRLTPIALAAISREIREWQALEARQRPPALTDFFADRAAREAAENAQ